MRGAHATSCNGKRKKRAMPVDFGKGWRGDDGVNSLKNYLVLIDQVFT